MKTRSLIKLLTITIILGTLVPAKAQPNTEKIKTIFVFNFTRYIQWPNTDNTIRIAVLGNDQGILNAFKAMASAKSTASNKIVVDQINSAGQAASYQMVYVPENNSAVVSQLKGLNETLIITEKPGMAKKGSNINFIMKDGKIRFEINKAATSQSAMKVSGQLMGLAIVV